MIYFTQLIYLKPGCEALFHAFEDKVLPLLEKYNGHLLYRIRPNKSDIVHTGIEHPYEIHILTFQSKEDFHNYAKDPERQQFMHLKESSVARTLLIEGIAH